MDWLLAICFSILCTSSRLALIRFTASMPFWKFALDYRMYRCDCSSVLVSYLHSSSKMLILLYDKCIHGDLVIADLAVLLSIHQLPVHPTI